MGKTAKDPLTPHTGEGLGLQPSVACPCIKEKSCISCHRESISADLQISEETMPQTARISNSLYYKTIPALLLDPNQDLTPDLRVLCVYVARAAELFQIHPIIYLNMLKHKLYSLSMFVLSTNNPNHMMKWYICNWVPGSTENLGMGCPDACFTLISI